MLPRGSRQPSARCSASQCTMSTIAYHESRRCAPCRRTPVDGVEIRGAETGSSSRAQTRWPRRIVKTSQPKRVNAKDGTSRVRRTDFARRGAIGAPQPQLVCVEGSSSAHACAQACAAKLVRSLTSDRFKRWSLLGCGNRGAAIAPTDGFGSPSGRPLSRRQSSPYSVLGEAVLAIRQKSVSRVNLLTLTIGLLEIGALSSLSGCGDDGTSNTDASASDMSDAVPTDLASEVEDVDNAELCGTIWGRLTACGLSTSFTDFETRCPTFDVTETATLDTCKIKPCAGLLECVNGLYE